MNFPNLRLKTTQFPLGYERTISLPATYQCLLHIAGGYILGFTHNWEMLINVRLAGTYIFPALPQAKCVGYRSKISPGTWELGTRAPWLVPWHG